MRIKHVGIRNFRTLRDVGIDFDKVTTFIGPNGTGKSTVLRALDWFFNGKAGVLTSEDCSFGAVENDIEVEVSFDQLTVRDREELGKYAPTEATTFTAWKRRSPDGSEVLSANSKGFEEFGPIKTASAAAERKALYIGLRNARPELNLPIANTGPAIESAMTTWESQNTDRLTDVADALQTNFFGFNSGGKMSGLFDFVLVTADLRAGEEAQDGKASIIGRILERSIDRSSADDRIAAIVEQSRIEQQSVYNELFDSPLRSIAGKLNAVVSTYSPGREISVTPSEIELKAPKTTFNVSVVDGETETVVERQGHGFQRTLLVSALQLLAQSGAEGTEGVICLAIEEPELFQHPIQAQTFAKVLRELAEDGSKRMQVTYATHSPHFVEARHFEQVRRLTRSAEALPVVEVHSATVQQIVDQLRGVTKPSTVQKQLDGVIANQLSVALFAQRVFLVEGTTESAVFYGLGDRNGSGSLEARGLSIVPVGGKTSIPIAHAILTALGVPTYALFDADRGGEDRSRANGKTPEKIAEERNGNLKANRALLRYFGEVETDFPDEVVSGKVSIFEDHLETFMKDRWPEWALTCFELERSAGVALSKNHSAYRTATLEAEGECPQMLQDILGAVNVCR